MLCKDNMVSLNYRSKNNNAKQFFLPSTPPFFNLKKKRKEKEAKQPIMKCMNVMQCKF